MFQIETNREGGSGGGMYIEGLGAFEYELNSRTRSAATTTAAAVSKPPPATTPRSDPIWLSKQPQIGDDVGLILRAERDQRRLRTRTSRERTDWSLPQTGTEQDSCRCLRTTNATITREPRNARHDRGIAAN